MNIKKWRSNIKAIVANDYYDAAVKVKANGDVILHNYAAGIESFEGNLKDREVQERWSRYQVERLIGPDVTFERWYFNSKQDALDKLCKEVLEDKGQQINLLDLGRRRSRIVRVTPTEDEHFIECVAGSMNQRGINQLITTQASFGGKYRFSTIQEVGYL